MAIFPTFFLGSIGQKNIFCDILERQIAFRGYKDKTFKKSRNWHFSKGVNPWLWSKNGHFSNIFFFGNTGKKNVFYDILEPKIAFQDYKNKTLKKSKNWQFFQRFYLSPSKGDIFQRFWSKNGHFSKIFFLGNIGPKNVFYDILKWKSAFLGYKNKKFKQSKNWHFSKWITHGFWSKNGHLSKILF